MSKFILEIELGNDAMRENADVVAALRGVASRLERTEYPMDEDIVRSISDRNGNMVGNFRVETNLFDDVCPIEEDTK
jgi:hypothetical protein